MQPSRPRPVLALALALALAQAAACTHVPKLEDAVPPELLRAPYPPLVPLDLAVPPREPPTEAAADLQAELDARRARLRTRARALQPPALDEDTRRRMARGVTR